MCGSITQNNKDVYIICSESSGAYRLIKDSAGKYRDFTDTTVYFNSGDSKLTIY